MRVVAFVSMACVVLASAAGCGSASPAGPASSSVFENAGARLTYVVDRPSGAGPFPGIVLAHEGGMVTKESLASLGGALAQHGFLVLRFDKRGVGQSTGVFESVTADNSTRVFTLLSSDLVAAVQTLKGQAGINATHIGLVGASEAGWIMPLAASQSADVRFIAAVVGPTVSVGLLFRYVELVSANAYTSDQVSQMLAGFTGPAGFDPKPILQSLNIPGLWQMGTSDLTVPTRESVAIVNDLIANFGKRYQVLQYAAGHELRQSPTYLPDLYAWLDTMK